MGQQSILIIDDEPLVLSVLGRLLSNHYKVFSAPSLEQAKTLFHSTDEIDLVMVDYLIGNTTGLEFLNHVRKTKPHIKRILMSGKMGAEAIANTFNNEIAHRVITKPWNNAELLVIIHQILCQKPKTDFHSANPENKVILTGTLTGISVADLVCLLTTNNKNGILLLKSERLPDAKIYICSGRIVDAVAAGVSGTTVAEALLQRTEGSFCFQESTKFDIAGDNIPLDQQILVI